MGINKPNNILKYMKINLIIVFAIYYNLVISCNMENGIDVEQLVKLVQNCLNMQTILVKQSISLLI